MNKFLLLLLLACGLRQAAAQNAHALNGTYSGAYNNRIAFPIPTWVSWFLSAPEIFWMNWPDACFIAG